ncbi:4-hydroxy-tetrahydrodipicolinate synthase [Dehalococcoides mccartyi]|jgi:4-hydroxy-tetrahydrodipicolinate synthase|uniref:4-hydroxy-tetrahydrodipicolinate synthase n=1 Tax=Dehalococcoides mccartyi TaxID=61435 RepID=UPI00099D2BA9|nr:4-hydroxy-tetrahydrodipicolinate synthase [Dehalococcoides mccartyi]AQX74704.1 4-hydroxy-tetrahydrodipicolinate synthase [Dehalococcoides mccartyi]AQY73281.1 4-hydroxy-tetrahydrodipicolinate synthase [Dehalococcoides mccartyi]
MKELGRLITAMVTPFKTDGTVGYAQAQKLALGLLDSGSDGLVVVGTTGESPTVTWEEEHALFAAVKSAVGNRGKVIAGTGANSTQEALENTLKAEKIGVDACLLVVPYYNKPTQEGLYLHFKTIAEATKLPCILYNVPSRTITHMNPETVIRLSQIPNIVGIKEASGKLDDIAQIINNVRPDFTVWSGNDSDTLPMLAMGSYGVISVASHLVGNQIKDMITSFVSGNTEHAAAIHRHLTPLIRSLFVVSNPIPIKYALNYLGFEVGGLRLPMTEADEKTAALIRESLRGYTIDLPIK